MNSLDPILVIDVNVIIHFEKAGLLDVLVNDKNIRIVDLVLYQEYQYKKNAMSNKVSSIRVLTLSEKQMQEAYNLFLNNRRNSVFDYFSYIAARDNNFVLLTGDFKLKKVVDKFVDVYGAIWYLEHLYEKKVIDKEQLLQAYEIWLNDDMVYMPNDILLEKIEKIKQTD